MERVRVAMVGLMLGCVLSVAGNAPGSIYVLASDVDWYAAGMTDVNNGIYGTGLKTDTSVTNRLQAIDRQGWGYPVIPTGYWTGANWTAPTGEVITKVEITGYHANDNPADPTWGYAVLGGTAGGAPTDVALMSGTGTEPSNGALAYSNSATRTIGDGITQLQFRALVALQDTQVASSAVAGYGYFGAINSVIITTVPEPATCLFVLISGLGFLTRRQLRK